MGWRFKKESKIIKIGENFVVAPPWIETQKEAISLIEGYSFGTGIHETTVSCVEFLESIDVSNKAVLDVGCGSGILSIVAARLNAGIVYAFDADPQAVFECKQNAELNKVSNIHCFESNNIRGIDATFDIIVANIFDDIIISFSSDISKLTNKCGYVILSGISYAENFSVRNTFIKLGYTVIKNRFLEDYTSMMLQKI